MSMERFGLIILLLGSIVFVLCGFWILFHPTANSSTGMALGVIALFGVSAFVFWQLLRKHNASMPIESSDKFDQILPLIFILVFAFYEPLAVLLVVPLLFAWALLYPKYTKRTVFYISSAFVLLVIALQFLMIATVIYDVLSQSTNLVPVALGLYFLVMVVWLDLQVLSELRRKYRASKQFAIW